MEVLRPQYDLIWDRDFKEVTKVKKGWDPNAIGPVSLQEEETPWGVHAEKRTQPEDDHGQTKDRDPGETSPAGPWLLDFQLPDCGIICCSILSRL